PNATLNLASVVHANWCHLDSNCRRHGLDCSKLGGSKGKRGISKDANSFYAWCNFFKELQPFRADAVIVCSKPRGVTARPRKGLNKAGANGVAAPAPVAGHVRVRAKRSLRCRE